MGAAPACICNPRANANPQPRGGVGKTRVVPPAVARPRSQVIMRPVSDRTVAESGSGQAVPPPAPLAVKFAEASAASRGGERPLFVLNNRYKTRIEESLRFGPTPAVAGRDRRSPEAGRKMRGKTVFLGGFSLGVIFVSSSQAENNAKITQKRQQTY